MSSRKIFYALNLTVAGLVLACVNVAHAATFTVTTTVDDDGPCLVGDCALREAILAANATPGMDSVILPSGTFQLSIQGVGEGNSMTGDLDILSDMEILGDTEHRTVIRGDGTDRIFTVGAADVLMSSLIIEGGFAPSIISSDGGAIIVFRGNLLMEGCTIRDNQAYGNGGGVSVALGSNVTLINTFVANNRAGIHGGGIYRNGAAGEPADVTLINSTVSGNYAFLNGGGILGIDSGEVMLVHSTIANNTALNEASAIFDSGFTTFWTNSLVVGDCRRAAISNGGNIESPGNTCGFDQPTDLVDIAEPGLGPLAYNGGPTRTHALLPGSPAIDAGVDAGCEATDQRGVARPYDGDGDGVATCDAGAVEFTGVNLDIPTLGGVGLVSLVVLLGIVALRMFAIRRSSGLKSW